MSLAPLEPNVFCRYYLLLELSHASFDFRDRLQTKIPPQLLTPLNIQGCEIASKRYNNYAFHYFQKSFQSC